MIEVRPEGERTRTNTSWLDSRHSFSFGGQYDPDNVHHGLLLVNNDDRVRAGTGFSTHPHQDMEIVTWCWRASSSTRTPRGTPASSTQAWPSA